MRQSDRVEHAFSAITSVHVNNNISTTRETDWLSALRRYLIATGILNLLWEFAHMPLYTVWTTGTRGEIVFAAVHCTGGDILIALAALAAALVIFGKRRWPGERFVEVYGAALVIGILYTAFSEWLNIEVRASWEYSEAMPVVPIINMGLSPLLQWIVIPTVAFYWASRPVLSNRAYST